MPPTKNCHCSARSGKVRAEKLIENETGEHEDHVAKRACAEAWGLDDVVFEDACEAHCLRNAHRDDRAGTEEERSCLSSGRQ